MHTPTTDPYWYFHNCLTKSKQWCYDVYTSEIRKAAMIVLFIAIKKNNILELEKTQLMAALNKLVWSLGHNFIYFFQKPKTRFQL
jgi:hypothetical protein